MVIFQLLSILISLINENMSKDDINGLKQPSWTYYVIPLEK